MSVHREPSDDDLPDLKAIIMLPPPSEAENARRPTSTSLRRSPRKNVAATTIVDAEQHVNRHTILIGASSILTRSSKQRASPTKMKSTTTTRSPLKVVPQIKAAPAPALSLLQNIPILPRQVSKTTSRSQEGREKDLKVSRFLARRSSERDDVDVDVDGLLLPLTKMRVQNGDQQGESDVETVTISRKPEQRQTQSHRTGRSFAPPPTKTISQQPSTIPSRNPKSTSFRASRFVLDEATCDEDLIDSDANNEHDDQEADTDLSGFIVDDDADITFYENSSEATDSEEERRSRRKAQRQREKEMEKEKEKEKEREKARLKTKPKPRRRLQRGRKAVSDSEEEKEGKDDNDDALVNALGSLNLDAQDSKRKGVEVVDLTSSPEHRHSDDESQTQLPGNTEPAVNNLFEKLKALKLSPPRNNRSLDIPFKTQPKMFGSSVEEEDDDDDEETRTRRDRFTTPPATPPRSPTKLKSPSKLMSPSKRGDATQKSPHRQSTDAFWDLNEVNNWNDQFSPKKAPLTSPRKNRLAALELWSDLEEDEDEEEGEERDENTFEAINEASFDSLPSPCESPSKSRSSRAVSPIKLEKQRLLAEKRARENEKKIFEASKDQMATELFHALDQNVTGGQISKLAASTGGVQIIWSNTLRSTAGRANWRRVVIKATTGSPVKSRHGGDDINESHVAGGTKVQHFASIELATKVIDRTDRLTNTLAHEFCHLANFMVSNVHDQPHGASFQRWAGKVTTWMKSQGVQHPEWSSVQVTTKHGYVIEWKYLWMCTGRNKKESEDRDGDEGCGAEYGRHSRSIDTDKHRCGRCKGILVQVRPRPRKASPIKKKPTAAKVVEVETAEKVSGSKRDVLRRSNKDAANLDVLNKMVEIIELSE